MSLNLEKTVILSTSQCMVSLHVVCVMLKEKKNIRLMKLPIPNETSGIRHDLRSVSGGVLYQQTDTLLYNENDLKVVTKKKPSDGEMASLKFAWKVAKHVKSNSIIF